MRSFDGWLAHEEGRGDYAAAQREVEARLAGERQGRAEAALVDALIDRAVAHLLQGEPAAASRCLNEATGLTDDPDRRLVIASYAWLAELERFNTAPDGAGFSSLEITARWDGVAAASGIDDNWNNWRQRAADPAAILEATLARSLLSFLRTTRYAVSTLRAQGQATNAATLAGFARRCTEVRSAATDAGNVSLAAYVTWCAADLYHRGGDAETAVALLDEARGLYEQVGDAAGRPLPDDRRRLAGGTLEHAACLEPVLVRDHRRRFQYFIPHAAVLAGSINGRPLPRSLHRSGSTISASGGAEGAGGADAARRLSRLLRTGDDTRPQCFQPLHRPRRRSGHRAQRSPAAADQRDEAAHTPAPITGFPPAELLRPRPAGSPGGDDFRSGAVARPRGSSGPGGARAAADAGAARQAEDLAFVLSPLYRARAARDAGDDKTADRLIAEATAALARVDSSQRRLFMETAVLAEQKRYAEAADKYRPYIHAEIAALPPLDQVDGFIAGLAKQVQKNKLIEALIRFTRLRSYGEAKAFYEAICSLAGERWWTIERRPWLSLSDIGEMYEGLGELEKALSFYDEGIAVLEARRRQLSRDEARTALAADQGSQRLYFLACRTLFKIGDDQRALAYAERGKARALLDLMAGSDADGGDERRDNPALAAADGATGAAAACSPRRSARRRRIGRRSARSTGRSPRTRRRSSPPSRTSPRHTRGSTS